MKANQIVGGVIRLKTFQAHSADGKVRETYGAPKGQVFICMILGIEEQPWTGDDKTYRHDKLLNNLGWYFQEARCDRLPPYPAQ